MIDGLLHNETIKSDIHSTDSHGFTEVVFAVTHLLGFTFAPRLKKLSKHRLYSFEKRKIYEDQGFQILPKAYIDTKLIEENWDDILRFVATIKLKHTTASQLFKRLNSYSKQHPLYQALKEFGKIIKTLFILRYIDDVELRQAIEKQLNKIEHAHRFAKAVAFANNQEFSEGEKELQNVAADCRRLIENSIICWNYLYLTNKLTEMPDDHQRQALLESIKAGSIITWKHINFHGEYDFSAEKMQDSVGLNLPKILALKWEAPNYAKLNEDNSLAKILWNYFPVRGFLTICKRFNGTAVKEMQFFLPSDREILQIAQILIAADQNKSSPIERMSKIAVSQVIQFSLSKGGGFVA